MKLTIDGAEYEYEVRYINNRAVTIGYRSYLRDADLAGAKLYRADLRGANLALADLTCADLTRADLRFANLCYANLDDANLRGADLLYADLRSAYLRGAKNLSTARGLATIKGKPATLPEGWKFDEGKGIYKAAPQDPEPTCAHIQHGKFCSDCGVAL